MAKAFSIRERELGNGHPVFIVAEAGVNHNGSLKLAKRLVDVASDAGADAIKFQTFKADRLVAVGAPKAKYQLETTSPGETQYEMIKKLQLTYDDFRALSEYSERHGLIFLSTPFDEESVDFLVKLDVPALKVASSEITNTRILKKVGSTNKPVIMSTGMSSIEEIRAAMRILRKNGAKDILLLHCVSEYPAKLEHANLRAIETLRRSLDVHVGYSDHTEGILASIVATALGACLIEKHFTLDRSMSGPDHKASLEPAELRMMVSSVRSTQLSLGDGQKRTTSEEEENKLIARRSIFAAQDILKGESIEPWKVVFKRPGTGISPMQLSTLLGRKASRTIKKDEMIEFESVSQ